MDGVTHGTGFVDGSGPGLPNVLILGPEGLWRLSGKVTQPNATTTAAIPAQAMAVLQGGPGKNK